MAFRVTLYSVFVTIPPVLYYIKVISIDLRRLRSKDVTSDCLEFNAQFESGNLRKATQVSLVYQNQYFLDVSPTERFPNGQLVV